MYRVYYGTYEHDILKMYHQNNGSKNTDNIYDQNGITKRKKIA